MATPVVFNAPGKLLEAARNGTEFRVSTLGTESLRVSQKPEHQLPAGAIREALLSGDQGLDPRGIRVVGARITGRLDLRHVHPDIGLALVGCAFDDELTIEEAHLPWLALTGSSMPRLAANGLEVDGKVDLDAGFTVVTTDGHAVKLIAAHIHGKLNLSGARLISKSGSGLAADRLRVDGSLCLKDQFYASGAGQEGTLSLAEAHIGGQLILTQAELVNDSGPAFIGEQLTVDGAVFMSEPFKAVGHGSDGTIRLRSATLGNGLVLDGARLTNDSGPAFSADGIRIAADLSMKNGLQVSGYGERGAVRMTGARIAGELDASSAQISNSTGPAISARDLQVSESIYLCEGFTARGEGQYGAVRLTGADIGAQFVGNAARIANASGPALAADRLHVHNDIDFSTDVRLTGSVVLAGAVIEGELDLTGIELLDKNGRILDLTATKTREFALSPAKICSDDREHAASTAEVNVAGLTYAFFPGVDYARWRHLLRHHTPEYSPQPYQQLALLLKSYGHDNEARTVLRAQQDDLRARGDLGGWFTRGIHWLWGKFAGYGYRIRRVAAALGCALILASLLGIIAGSVTGDNGRRVAAPVSATTPAGTTCSLIERVGLGLDRGLPLATTGIRSRCDLDTYSSTGQLFTAGLWLIQLAVWALATLAIAGYTGLIRRLS
ncbi:hypothetical protein [Amycolatopsis sp. lyj-90]|uniref:hypothetical protein n=1 Tax=Amycolatopsis sp. lyj-90 TaxID=2789285 RepID=UPI00397A603B